MMAEKQLIEPSFSSWSSPALLVAKRDGSMRFCVDYRKLNEVTVPDSHPLPRIDDTLSALGGAQWFSTLDLKSGYHQISIRELDRPLTAFSIPGSGLWQWRVLPFGLINAPSAFERLMERVMNGLTFVSLLIYLDDIIVYSKTFEEHLENLREVFQRLQEANLKLNPKKCCLFRTEVSFLGHKVSASGIATDPEKVQTIRDWPRPRNVKEVRQFIGLASYYRKFLFQFAQTCKPLHKLTEQNSTFTWTQDCEQAFETIKTLLTTAPVLSYPSSEGETFILDTDASNVAVGAVLHQLQDGEDKVIGYFSKCLSRTERKYCTTRKELVAIVKAVKHFHYYIYGQPLIIRSDHGSLQWLLNFRNHGEGQLARFLETLSAYSFKIVHRSATAHKNADALSRRPCYDNNCQYCARYESRYGSENVEAAHSQRETTTNRICDSKVMCDSIVKNENNPSADLQTRIEDQTAVKCVVLASSQFEPCTERVLETGKPFESAPFCMKQDCDPDNYSGPRDIDTMLYGGSDYTPSYQLGVTSVVSEETTLRDVTGCGPSPIVSCLRTNVVDEKTHQVIDKFTYCCPNVCSCQVAVRETEDWLDLFEGESMLGFLFGFEECGRNGGSLETPTHLNNVASVELNVEHAGMVSTRRNAHEDLVHCPCVGKVFCVKVDPDQNPSDDPQSGSGRTNDINSSCNIETENGCFSHTNIRAIHGQTDECPEITKENIRAEQEKDPTLSLLLQWKQGGSKPSWADVAQYCKELKVYWHRWDALVIKEGVLCRKYEWDLGTGADYLYILPQSLRKNAFQQLHAYVTGGHLGRSKTYEKLKKRFYWCNMHRDVSYWCR
ncbi:MAG: reverse transcriptase domain-containing protein, partial [Candidatus Thiodiazotropha endolucinida]|nr:hypothetical protein [Candidatus Thiodiazotropha taylori]MCW4345707.1 reverse transcriptase domain-containing protein [Candidatus Thiodiazotropha endolucinida]